MIIKANKPIFICFDFSKQAYIAIKQSIELAKALHATIEIIQVAKSDAELRIKEIIKLLEESHEFRDTRNFNDTESWETSKWTYDAGMAMAFQDCGTEKASSKVSQEDSEAAAQEAIRRY